MVLTAVNLLGVREGKWTQNVLTAAKVAGLTAIVAVGFLCVAPVVAAPAPVKPPAEFSWADLGLAMIFVLFTYGGWNEMAFVAGEVKEPRKNILRALLVGTLAVTVIYVLVNVAFLHSLGLGRPRRATVARRGPRAGHRPLGGPGHESLGVHFRPRRDQRPNLHRIAQSTSPWAASIGSTPGWVDGTPGAARQSARC